MTADDYNLLVKRLNQPPVTIVEPAPGHFIAHEPPPHHHPIVRTKDVQRIFRALRPSERRPLLDIAYAMLDQAGLRRPDTAAGLTGSVDYVLLTIAVESCARRFQFWQHTRPIDARPGGLWAPMDASGHFRERSIAYFLHSWHRAVRYYLPIRLPLPPPALPGLIEELPAGRQDQWRTAIGAHFRAKRGSAARPSVLDVSREPLDVWRTAGFSESDVQDLVEVLRRFGLEPPTAHSRRNDVALV